MSMILKTPVAQKALLIEKDVASARLHRQRLEQLGYVVDLAENGQHAIAKLDAGHRYEIVVMDVDLADMPASQAAKYFCRYQQVKGLMKMAVLLTDNISLQTARACLAVGITEALRKPVSKDQFWEFLTAESLDLSWG